MTRKCIFRYDYENCEDVAAKKMMDDLNALVEKSDFVGKKFSDSGREFEVSKGDNFAYTDPVDASVAKNQVKKT